MTTQSQACPVCNCPATSHRYREDGASFCAACLRVGCRAIQAKPGHVAAAKPDRSLDVTCTEPPATLDLSRLEPAARRALERMHGRLLAGQERYGRVDPATDRRDWVRETQDELIDAVAYLEWLSERDGGGK